MIKPSKNAHFLSDLLRKVDEKKPENEVSAQVNSSFCFKNKIATFTKSSRGTSNNGPCSFARSAAFTLAEVLVTLGIIGIVAAMTLPTVIDNSRNKQLETQNKRAQTVLANGFNMLKAKEEVNDLSYTSFVQCAGNGDCIATSLRKVFHVIEDSVDGKTVALPASYNFSGDEYDFWTNGMSDKDICYIFVTNDGIIYGIEEFQANADTITVYTDINGNKRPNKGGEDLCKFIILKNGLLRASCDAMKTISDNSGSGTEESCGDRPANCMNYDESLCMCTECEDGYSLSGDERNPCTETD